ncbi:MAG: Stp1/IreP family PP2C-type Ser/Thr phosphatase [Clostridia bacterium]|nr:Stp1/IreP family PP2C-type Ser/Thr phosphatase [Clostridia bacterium]
MKAYAITDKGLVRPLNEDYYYLPSKGESFTLLADGMGGHAAGEVASMIAVSACAEMLRKTKTPSREKLSAAFSEANRRIYDAALTKPQQRGMGTTLVALCILEKQAALAHVGDSRAYRLRNASLTQMTTDHSYVEELVKSGIITREQARTHPKRNIITRCVGTQAEIEADIVITDLEGDDLWLLCSDGLTGFVADEAIEAVLISSLSPMEKLKALRDAALSNGGSDNITAVLVSGGNA